MEMRLKKSIELAYRLDYRRNIELNTQSKAANNDFAIKSKIAKNEIITYPEVEMEFFFWKSH
jgi:hypothetical protein